MLYLLALIPFAFLAWKDRRSALLVIMAALPSYLLRFQIAGVPFTVLEGMILLVVALWLIEMVRSKKKLALEPGLLIGLGLIFLAGTVAVFVSPDLRAGGGIWKAYFVEPLLFFLAAKFYFRKHDASAMVAALSLGGLAIALYGLGQRFFGIPIVAPWQSELRITGIFEYPNAVGLYLAPLVPLFVWQGLKNWNDGQNITIKKIYRLGYWVLVVAASLAAIYFAKTWGAMVALIVVGGVYGVTNKKTRRATLAMIIGFVVALSLASAARHTIIQKISFQSWSGIVRVKMYQETVQMLQAHPIFGAGLAGYQTAIRPYHVNQWMEIFLYPHDIVLAVWSELGILGLLAFGWIFGWLIKKLFSRRDGLALAVIASLSVLLIHGLVDVPYFKNDLAVIFWVVVLLGTLTD